MKSGPSDFSLYGVYPLRVVPTKSTPAFSAFTPSSNVEISAISKISGYFSFICLINSFIVFPSTLSLKVQSRATISAPASISSSISFIVTVICCGNPSYTFFISPITGKLTFSFIPFTSSTPFVLIPAAPACSAAKAISGIKLPFSIYRGSPGNAWQETINFPFIFFSISSLFISIPFT